MAQVMMIVVVVVVVVRVVIVVESGERVKGTGAAGIQMIQMC